jgi:hypothetical protein
VSAQDIAGVLAGQYHFGVTVTGDGAEQYDLALQRASHLRTVITKNDMALSPFDLASVRPRCDRDGLDQVNKQAFRLKERRNLGRFRV